MHSLAGLACAEPRRASVPGPAADLEKIQRDDGSAKAPEPHAPAIYRRNEGVFVVTLPCNCATTARRADGL